MLESLLCPKSVAVIGASRTSGKVGHEIVANLLEGGFAGEIIPVNPSADQVLGLTCYQDLKDYPGTVDLSLIAVPVATVLPTVESSIKAGVKAIAIITAGFREIGAAGVKIESQIQALCAKSGIRLLGPNCLGVINTHHKMNASFSKKLPRTGGISVLSQSGAVCTAMLDWAATRHLGLAKLVSMGNKADLNETDILLALTQDEQTKVIVGYLENTTSGKSFMKAAESAVAAKPVIIFRAGITQAGIRAASAHTGYPAGDEIAYAAAFKRCGVIRADSFDSLFDYAAAMSMQPLPQGNRVAIVTNAGGPGVMAADAIEQAEMKMAALNDHTAAALGERLPPAAIISNPIDILGDADPKRFAVAVELAQNDGSVDAIIVIITPHAMTKPTETVREIAMCSTGKKTILVVFFASTDAIPRRQELADYNLPDYPTPERAVAALRVMTEYADWQRRPPRIVTRFPVNRRRVDRIIARHLRTKRTLVGEVGAKEILRAYDFTVPEGQVAYNPEEAVVAAEKIGFPVAMKIVSPDIVHKYDVGGIKLQVSSPEEVRDTFDLLTLRLNRRAPEARLLGIYVEKMCDRGLEVILGMTYDPHFGPMLMFGLGGIFVDVLRDLSCYLAPITADEALRMLKETRSYSMLKGARGQSDVDLNAIASGLQRMSQMATDFPQISELNINPFIVGNVGMEPMVVDASITLTQVGGP